jgi:hypothetical protein
MGFCIGEEGVEEVLRAKVYFVCFVPATTVAQFQVDMVSVPVMHHTKGSSHLLSIHSMAHRAYSLASAVFAGMKKFPILYYAVLWLRGSLTYVTSIQTMAESRGLLLVGHETLQTREKPHKKGYIAEPVLGCLGV